MVTNGITITVHDETRDFWALVAELTAIECERRGMDAENALRQVGGNSLAYGMEAYYELAKRGEAVAAKMRLGKRPVGEDDWART